MKKLMVGLLGLWMLLFGGMLSQAQAHVHGVPGPCYEQYVSEYDKVVTIEFVDNFSMVEHTWLTFTNISTPVYHFTRTMYDYDGYEIDFAENNNAFTPRVFCVTCEYNTPEGDYVKVVETSKFSARIPAGSNCPGIDVYFCGEGYHYRTYNNYSPYGRFTDSMYPAYVTLAPNSTIAEYTPNPQIGMCFSCAWLPKP